MKIKVVAHTSNKEGQHVPGEIIDIREATALEWIKRGWAIARPDLEEKREDPKPEPAPPDDDDGEIETAMMPGAPEVALNKRGRKRRE